MVVDWDSDSSGLELDRRELVLGWRGWRLALSTKAARVLAPVVRRCLLIKRVATTRPSGNTKLSGAACGKFIYLRHTKPECAYAISQVCRFASTPTKQAWQQCRRIAQYAYNTRHRGVKFTRTTDVSELLSVRAFADASSSTVPTLLVRRAATASSSAAT